MTLFEAIRQLKEGQKVVHIQSEAKIVIWKHGCKSASFAYSTTRTDGNDGYTIVDLPRPQTLYDVLVEGADRVKLDVECESCFRRGECPINPSVPCYQAAMETLQSIALAAGFDLKKVVK